MKLRKVDRAKVVAWLLASTASAIWGLTNSNLTAAETFILGGAYGATTALVSALVIAEIRYLRSRKRRAATRRTVPTTRTRTDQA